jgi:protein phosphatase 1 regulatory subunit 14B
MASKLRRAPLFGIDSGFSLVSPLKTAKSVFQMECEVNSVPPTNYGGGGANRTTATATTNGRSSSSPSRSSNGSTASTGSHKSQLHVDFIESNGEVKEKREKYLTAKYGSHQMSLIRKRLSVEMWLYDELQKLFEAPDGTSSATTTSTATANHDVEIDLDEVLDMDGDVERRKFLLSLLTQAKKSPEVVNKFIDDVLEKAKTL